MLNFQFYERVKVLFGKGCAAQLGELAELIGGKKALIVCDPGMEATGTVDTVVKYLKDGDWVDICRCCSATADLTTARAMRRLTWQ